MATAPVTLQSWGAHYAQAGAVYALSFLTPSGTGSCRNDKRAYELLVAPKNVAQILGGVQELGLSVDIPGPGHKRVTDQVWLAYVQIARPVILGDVLPRSLAPCPELPRQTYTLQMVTQIRESGNWLNVAGARWNDLNETPLSQLVETGAGKLGDATAATLSTALSALVRGALPLAIPLAVAVFIYARAKR